MDVEKLLLRKVVSEKQIITYRLLSRLVPCHVDLAKQHLYKFYTSDAARKASVHASYLVVGSAKGEKNGLVNGDAGKTKAAMEMDLTPAEEDEGMQVVRDEEVEEQRIEVVDEEDLEEYKKELAPITRVHIYSLEPTRLPDITLLCPPNDILHTDPKLVKAWEASKMGAEFGLFKLNGVKMIGVDAKIRQNLAPNTASAAATSKATSSSKPAASTKPAPAEKDKKTEKEKDKKTSTAGGSSIKNAFAVGAAASFKKTEAAKKKAAEEEKPKKKEKKKDPPEVKKEPTPSKSTSKGKAKATTIIESDEEEEEDEFAADRRAAEREEAMTMDLDVEMGEAGHDEVEVVETPKAKGKGKGKSESPVVSKKKAPTEANGGAGRKRVTKTRIVQKPKIVKEKDAKGYRVKREIMEEVEEEYTDWESDPEDVKVGSGKGKGKKRKSEAVEEEEEEEEEEEVVVKEKKEKSKAAGGSGKKDKEKESGGSGLKKSGAPGSQSNLMSFFGKK